MLGVLQDFSGLTAELPVWVTQAVVIVFTPFLCGMIAQLSLENSEHLNAALVRAQAVNERLRESEAALGRQATSCVRLGHVSWPPPTASAAASSATSTTAPSSDSSP